MCFWPGTWPARPGLRYATGHAYGPARNSVSRMVSKHCKINVETALEVRFCTCPVAHTRSCRSTILGSRIVEMGPYGSYVSVAHDFRIWTRFLRKYVYSHVSDFSLIPGALQIFCNSKQRKAGRGLGTRLTCTYSTWKWEKSCVAIGGLMILHFLITLANEIWWW